MISYLVYKSGSDCLEKTEKSLSIVSILIFNDICVVNF